MHMSKTITFPGLIDCHVHFREPGFEHKATMASEAAAARAGGVTTVCEMPNTVPSTVSIAALEDKVRRAMRVKDCDIRFFMGATEERHLLAMRDLWRLSSPHIRELKARCCGLKLYFDHSTGNQGADAKTLELAFKLCAELSIPIIAHCEDPEVNAQAKTACSGEDIALHSVMRPPVSEAVAIADAIELAHAHDAAVHIAHLSTAQGIELVAEAKRRGVRVTCEVAPHHLFLTTEDYTTLGTLGKMNPPLRTAEHRDALWKGIADGTVDCIATDHAPHTLEEKHAAVPLSAPSGVPGVETMLPLLLTVAAGGWPHPTSARPKIPIFQYSQIPKLCFTNPNRIFGLGKKETDATVTVDTEAAWTIDGAELHGKCGWTPYEGWQVMGKVVKVEGK